MTLEERELLNTLCEEIQAEKDPARFAIPSRGAEPISGDERQTDG
jgi:hypothetical protein